VKLVEVINEEKNIYNRFVMNNESGSFLQSWEWGQWQSRLGRTVYRFKIIDNSEKQVGFIQLVKMPLPFGKYYLYAPYGPVLTGDKKLEIRNQKLDEITLLIKNQFSDCVFVRIEPKDNFQFPISNFQFELVKSSNIQPAKTLVLDLTKTEDQLLADMHQKTRYNIRLAQKHGVEIQDEFVLTVGKGLFAKEAVELIKQTAKRQGFTAQSKTYFEDLINFFVLKNDFTTSVENNSGQPFVALAKEGAICNQQADLKLHIYKALYNKQLLTSAIIIDFSAKGGSAFGGGTRTYLFGGSSEEYKNVMAPYLLHWQAVIDAKKNGITEYDFWGIETASGQTPGFVRFKLGFGGVQKQYVGAYDIVVKPMVYKLYKFSRHLNKLRKKISLS
jgi:lipid II:glycine glycyltransferase (peptidoglycan interpeptide bridge formation enzyme)